MKRYIFYQDEGHGWLQVPKAEAEAMSLPFTPYSYICGENVYLEEDCDMTMFLDIKKQSDPKWFANNVDVKITYNRSIRNMYRYECPHYSEAKFADYWKKRRESKS